ncbi:MAG: ABC transporter substrate-binding protein [Microthrixaceae bacterium]
MASRRFRYLVIAVAVGLLAASCGGSDNDEDADGPSGGDAAPPPSEIDYEAIGLWDDGPCDETKEPLRVGLMTTFESPTVSLGDQAIALEAAAVGFNKRGGANGSCIEVTTCDDGLNADQAVACAREVIDAGVVATINDQGLAGQADVSATMAEAGVPRVAGNVTPDDWGDPNSYPMDASGTGVSILLPQALINSDITEIAVIRVGEAEVAALIPILDGIYGGEATITEDIPVPAGTTDFGQFILAAQQADSTGAILALAEQEGIQVVDAAQQLSSDLVLGSSLGSFSQQTVADLGDFAEQMVFLWSFAPPTMNIPVYDAMRSDLAASGEEALQPEQLKASPVRSWIGLYAMLWMIRDQQVTEFSGEAMTAMLQSATDVPMLEMFGPDSWTPDASHPGVFARAGIDRWVTYEWNPDAKGDFEGNFEQTSEMSFDEVFCGSPFGAPAESC